MLSAVVSRAALIAAVLALGLVATGCGEVRSQTQWSTDRQQGVNAEAGEITINGVVVVADEESDRATVLATFSNDGGEDELVRVRVGSAEAEPEGGPLTIPANGYAKLGPDDASPDVAAPLYVEGSGAEIGLMAEVEFVFASAPRATVNAIVNADEDIYAGFLD